MADIFCTRKARRKMARFHLPISCKFQNLNIRYLSFALLLIGAMMYYCNCLFMRNMEVWHFCYLQGSSVAVCFCCAIRIWWNSLLQSTCNLPYDWQWFNIWCALCTLHDNLIESCLILCFKRNSIISSLCLHFQWIQNVHILLVFSFPQSCGVWFEKPVLLLFVHRGLRARKFEMIRIIIK